MLGCIRVSDIVDGGWILVPRLGKGGVRGFQNKPVALRFRPPSLGARGMAEGGARGHEWGGFHARRGRLGFQWES